MTQTKTLYIISHTHWDREWYRSFQEYRARALDVLDELIDYLSTVEAFECFLLDGQVILLEDYLALRPHRAPEIRTLVTNGRLQIGPWYVQPDEFLVSGEALIRNLMLGQKMGAAFGGVCKVGWLPDTFGHIAQLPQILRNFGIDSAIFSRGLGDEPVPPSGFFWWEAPGGERVLAVHQVGGYCNAGNLGFQSFWGRCDSSAVDLCLAERQVRHLIAQMDPNGEERVLVLWNGADHTPVQKTLPEILRHLSQTLPDYRLKHGRVSSLVRELVATGAEWPVLRGELNASRYQPLLPGTRSSRMGLKQANHKVQRTLERYAEPMATVAWLLGRDYPDAHLWDAWRLLFQNQCHDSICGCHIDCIEDRMRVRFAEAQEIADQIVSRALGHLAETISAPPGAPDAFSVLAFNPLGQERQTVVTAILRLPCVEPPYRAIAPDGQAAPVQILSHQVKSYEWLSLETCQEAFLRHVGMWRAYLRQAEGLDIARWEARREGDHVELCIRLGDLLWNSDAGYQALLAEVTAWPSTTHIHLQAQYHELSLAFQARVPACGYAAYTIERCAETATDDDCVYAFAGRLSNKFLEVDVAPDGTLSICHRASGRDYAGLHVIEDSADLGDTYDYCPLMEPARTAIPGAPVRIETVACGPLRAELVIHATYQIPAGLAADRRSRSDEMTLLPVTTTVGLSAGSHYVEIRSSVENCARDHRVRVVFPTGIRATTVEAGGHFTTISRSIELPPGDGWAQPPTPLQHHMGWFGVEDRDGGLAILTEALPEHEGLPEDAGISLALTLWRSVGCLSRGDLTSRPGHAGPAIETPNARCIGRHEYRYGILPYAPQGSVDVACQAEFFDVPVVVIPVIRRQGALPARGSFISLSPGSFALSAFKRSEDGRYVVARFYNRTETAITGEARFFMPLRAVWQSCADEKPTRSVALTADRKGCMITAGPSEIVTLLLEPLK